MARTIAEIEADIVTLKAAISEIVGGGRLTRLQLGSGEFARTYEFQELTYENLMAELGRLEAELVTVSPATETKYHTGNTLPMEIRKFNR